MSDIFQIRLEWRGGDGGLGTNTLYGQEGDVAVSEMRTALSTFFGTPVSGAISDDFNVTIPSTGDILDTNTGGLIGVWDSGTPIVKVGADTANRAADATQILVQLHTDLVLNGRLLRGRFFIPGLRVTGIQNGNLHPDIISEYTTAATTAFVGKFAVFSRTHFRWATVTRCSVWSELAVLRSRRA